MQNPKYDIVFEGRFVEGADPARVRAVIGRTFKMGPEKLEQFFSGRRIVFKKGVDLPEAHRFKNLMRKAGVACRLVPQDVILTDGTESHLLDRTRPPAMEPTRDHDEDETTVDIKTVTPAIMRTRWKHLPSVNGLRLWCNNFMRLGADLKTAFERRKPGRIGKLLVLLVVLATAVTVGVAAIWHKGGPMPADAAVLEAFTAGFNAELIAVETGRSRAVTHATIAKQVIEDMGYDYDQTLLYWHFNRELPQDARLQSIRDDYLIGPLNILIELDADRMKSIMAPDTYAAFEETLGIGEHITLRSIRLLRDCAQGTTQVSHEAIMAGFNKYGIPVEPDYPEIAVREAFYGLSSLGLIQIHKRREWKTKRVEIEILDRAQIADQERKLLQLDKMYARYTRRL